MAITEEEWQARKTILYELYSTSTLKNLIQVMKSEHGFCATKSQYETRFKMWSFRKNLNNSEWQYVLEKKRKRAALGKDTDVTFNGILVPHKKIKKEEQRYSISQISTVIISCPSPAPPDGIQISTPRAEIQDIVLGSSIGIDMPYFKFLTMFDFPSSNIYSPTQSRQLRLKCHIQPHYTPQQEILSGKIISSAGQIFSETSIQSPLPNPPMQLIFELFPNAGGGVTCVPKTQAQQEQVFLRRLKICMLERYEGDLEGQVTRLLNPSGPHALQELLKLMVYFSSNELLDYSQQKKALEWITAPQNEKLLKTMFSIETPTMQAFLDSMLRFAVKSRNTKCGKALLDTDSGRKLFSGRLGKLMHAAIQLGHIELQQVLARDGVREQVPVTDEISSEFEQVLQTIENTPRKVWRDGVTSWLEQVPSNYAEAQRVLAKHEDMCLGVNFRARQSGRTILQYSIETKHFTTGRRLVEAGANVNATISSNHGHQSLLQLALVVDHFPKEANIQLIKAMLLHGADPNAPSGRGLEYGTPLQIAASRSNLELVKILVSVGARINAPPGCSAHTVLQAASHAVAEYANFQSTNCDIVKYLLSQGADVNAPAASTFGRTALQVAVSARKPSLELVELLLQENANIHSPAGKRQGITALQGAAIQGHISIVQDLLERGADPNAPGSTVDGRTALEGAAEWGRLDTVQKLMDSGAEISSFESAATYAEKRGHFAVADLIKDRLRRASRSGKVHDIF